MDVSSEQHHQIQALAMRIAALEDNVAFLEEWCEEQQDSLDRAVGPATYDYRLETEAPPPPSRALLRIVDLRDHVPPAGDGEEEDDGRADSIFAVVETDHDKRVRHLRRQLNRLRTRLAETLAPSDDGADELSAKPAGRTAP